LGAVRVYSGSILLHQRLDPTRILKPAPLRPHPQNVKGLHQRLDPTRILKLNSVRRGYNAAEVAPEARSDEDTETPDSCSNSPSRTELHQRLDPTRILKLLAELGLTQLTNGCTRGSIRRGY